jgi:hypothetical protein
VFSNLLSGNDSFAAIRGNGNVISESLLSNGRLTIPVFSRHVTIHSPNPIKEVSLYNPRMITD